MVASMSLWNSASLGPARAASSSNSFSPFRSTCITKFKQTMNGIHMTRVCSGEQHNWCDGAADRGLWILADLGLVD